MNEQEAIKVIKNWTAVRYSILREALEIAIQALKNEAKRKELIEWYNSTEEFHKAVVIKECEGGEATPDCRRAEKHTDGTCLGYGKSEFNDEPIEVCKKCTKQASHEVESEVKP